MPESTTKSRHVATKTTPEHLDADDRELLERLRELRVRIERGNKAKNDLGPELIAALRARGVDPDMIADAFGVGRSRVYQVPPASSPAVPPADPSE